MRLRAREVEMRMSKCVEERRQLRGESKVLLRSTEVEMRRYDEKSSDALWYRFCRSLKRKNERSRICSEIQLYLPGMNYSKLLGRANDKQTSRKRKLSHVGQTTQRQGDCGRSVTQQPWSFKGRNCTTSRHKIVEDILGGYSYTSEATR